MQSNVSECRAAIARQWPSHLQAGAITVLTKENGLETADRKGALNNDGSQDFGCMQINNKAHPAFFANKNWANADENVAYGYQIFKSRGNWSAWYAVRGILW